MSPPSPCSIAGDAYLVDFIPSAGPNPPSPSVGTSFWFVPTATQTSGNTVYYSSDFTTWASFNISGMNSIYAGVYMSNGTRLVVVGGNQLGYSTNGNNWTIVTLGVTFSQPAIRTDGTNAYIVETTQSPTSVNLPYVATGDGITWTSGTLATTNGGLCGGVGIVGGNGFIPLQTVNANGTSTVRFGKITPAGAASYAATQLVSTLTLTQGPVVQNSTQVGIILKFSPNNLFNVSITASNNDTRSSNGINNVFANTNVSNRAFYLGGNADIILPLSGGSSALLNVADYNNVPSFSALSIPSGTTYLAYNDRTGFTVFGTPSGIYTTADFVTFTLRKNTSCDAVFGRF